MDLNVPRKSHFLSFMCRMPRSGENLKHLVKERKCDGSVMAVMKEAVKFAEVCYCSVLSRMVLATSLLFFLVSADFVSIQTLIT